MECLFRMLRYFHEKTENNFLERNKMHINQLIDIYSIQSKIEKDKYVVQLFQMFLQNPQLLSKRPFLNQGDNESVLSNNKNSGNDCFKKIKNEYGSYFRFGSSNFKNTADKTPARHSMSMFVAKTENYDNNVSLNSTAVRTGNQGCSTDKKDRLNTSKKLLQQKEHPLSHIASNLFDKNTGNCPVNPKLKMKLLFENLLKKDTGQKKNNDSLSTNLSGRIDLETLSEKDSISVRSYGNNSICSLYNESDIGSRIDGESQQEGHNNYKVSFFLVKKIG